MRYLIAGLGSIGHRHFRNLLALGERDILLYRTRQATYPEDELAGFPVETDLRSALAYNPDAVIISNPTALHLDVAIPSAQCGCHLLLEKPVSHSMARISELEQAVQENECKVLVGYQFRFNPGLQQVKRLLEEGAIGEPLTARAHWGEYMPDWHPWEDYKYSYAARPELGGGVVLTLCHPLDYLRWLLGEIESLVAFTSHAGLDLPVEDSAEITMRFDRGTLATVHLDYNQRPPAHFLEIIGSMGTLYCDNLSGIVRLSRVGPDDKSGPWKEFHPPDGFERNWMFLDELRHFREVINGNGAPACTLQDGIQSLQLALAARQEQLVHFVRNKTS